MSYRRLSLLLVPLFLIGCATGSDSPIGNDQTSEAGADSEPRMETVRLTAMNENNDVLVLDAPVEDDREGIVLRVEGQEYPLEERRGDELVFRNVRVPNLDDNSAKLVVPANDGEPELVLPFKIVREMRTIDEYRKYAQPVDYPQLSKAADRLAGTYVKGRGQLYQIQEESLLGRTSTWGGINVTPLGWGAWDGNIRFDMPGTTEFVQADVVNFYGQVEGSHEYETFAGGFLIAPYVEMAFMEK